MSPIAKAYSYRRHAEVTADDRPEHRPGDDEASSIFLKVKTVGPSQFIWTKNAAKGFYSRSWLVQPCAPDVYIFAVEREPFRRLTPDRRVRDHGRRFNGFYSYPGATLEQVSSAEETVPCAGRSDR